MADRWELWFAYLHEHYTKNTIGAYKHGVDLLRAFASDREITAGVVSEWLDSLEAEGFKSATVAQRSNAARALQECWILAGLMSPEPEWETRNALADDQRVMIPLSSEERMTLRYAAGQLHTSRAVNMRNFALIGVLLDAGPLRVSTINKLEVDAVSWQGGGASVAPRNLKELPAATRITARKGSVALSAPTGEALARYLWTPSGWPGLRYPGSGARSRLLWPTYNRRDLQRPLSRQGIHLVIQAASARAGISRPVGADLLRMKP